MLKELVAKSLPDYLSPLQQWPKSFFTATCSFSLLCLESQAAFIPYNPENKVVCIQRSLRWSSALSLIKLMEPAGILLISLDVWLPQWWPHFERVRRQGLGSPPHYCDHLDLSFRCVYFFPLLLLFFSFVVYFTNLLTLSSDLYIFEGFSSWPVKWMPLSLPSVMPALA